MGSASSAQRASEEPICKNLNHCVDILSRHAEDEFDYAVLTEEFRRFGPRGTDKVIGLLPKEKSGHNAAAFLHRARPQLSPPQAERLIKAWPAQSARNQLIDLVADSNAPSVMPLLKSSLISTKA